MSTTPTEREREEEKFSNIRWNSHYIVEQGLVELNEGDKIVLPATALEQLLGQVGGSSLPSPLTFELRHPHKPQAIIHSGVKEFSSANNTTVQLPQWMMSSLEVNQGDRVLIKLKLLPKGTWARLKPISEDYRDITDYRAALESHLRGHYNTLTKGQPLSCRYGGRVYKFQVVDLKPEDAVSITDTDLEVEIDPIHSTESNGTSASLSSSSSSSSSSNVVGLNETVTKEAIAKDEYVYWKLAALDLNKQQLSRKTVVIQVDVQDGDADVVISTENKRPTLEDHEWSDTSSNKEKRIQITTDLLVNKSLYIGFHGYPETTTVKWKATLIDTSEEMEIVNDEGNDEGNDDKEGKVECKNCHAWIAERTLMLHEGFCFRNNVLCPWGCGKVFKKDSEELKEHWHCDQCDYVGSNNEREKHTSYYHTPRTCTCNNFIASSYQVLAEHRRTTCPEKLITCRYCHNLTAQGVMSLDSRDRLLGLYSHESYCGSRTITCQKCQKPIPIKDIQVHAKIHEVKRQQQVLSPACANRNCIRPRAKNRLSLCQFCFGPFWVTEDDPKNAKLIQRVARKIHSQLTVGCGNEWCRNKYCATCTKDPKDATTAASLLIPLIKSLPRELSLPNPSPELYFCVDESTTRKKFLAEIVCNETENRYELGWCIKAIESEQEDLDRAKTWLDRNAPRRKI